MLAVWTTTKNVSATGYGVEKRLAIKFMMPPGFDRIRESGSDVT